MSLISSIRNEYNKPVPSMTLPNNRGKRELLGKVRHCHAYLQIAKNLEKLGDASNLKATIENLFRCMQFFADEYEEAKKNGYPECKLFATRALSDDLQSVMKISQKYSDQLCHLPEWDSLLDLAIRVGEIINSDFRNPVSGSPFHNGYTPCGGLDQESFSKRKNAELGANVKEVLGQSFKRQRKEAPERHNPAQCLSDGPREPTLAKTSDTASIFEEMKSLLPSFISSDGLYLPPLESTEDSTQPLEYFADKRYQVG